jgi:uncharacterized protein YbcC (UPF0753/DUF2309 family)
MTQDDFNNAVLTCTGHPEWELVKKGLANDIYQAQSRALDAKDWDEVCELKGFAKGLAFIISLRESTISAAQQGSSLLGDEDALL